MIPYEDLGRVNRPFFEEYKASFAAVLEKGWYILGKSVETFEQEWAGFLGVKHAIGLASGLDALVLALRALDIPRGSEIIVPSNTYIATILAIMQCDLVPVLVEPDIKTYNIDPAKIEAAITKNTRGLMIVHLYGKACDMDRIGAIVKKHGLKLIEDCAQSHGATWGGQVTGSFGEFGAFSFYPTKNLGALGDAGALVTNDDELAKKVRMLRNYGSEKKYYNEVVGYNSRLDEIQAAFLSIKLKKLREINEHKRKLAKIYLEGIRGDFVLPSLNEKNFDVYHIFNVRHKQRDELKAYLLANGVGSDIHYPVSPHRQTAMKAYLAGHEFPISQEIHDTTLSLPISYFHTESDVRQVVDTLNKFAAR